MCAFFFFCAFVSSLSLICSVIYYFLFLTNAPEAAVVNDLHKRCATLLLDCWMFRKFKMVPWLLVAEKLFVELSRPVSPNLLIKLW